MALQSAANVTPANWWIEAEWPVWRLVCDEKATLREIDAYWTLEDVLSANEALDVASDVSLLGSASQVRPDTPAPSRAPAARARNTRPSPPPRSR